MRKEGITSDFNDSAIPLHKIKGFDGTREAAKVEAAIIEQVIGARAVLESGTSTKTSIDICNPGRGVGS